jgi:epoxide hydrolase-like predicted phosphatase
LLTGLVVDYGGVLTDPGESDGTTGGERPLLHALLAARRHGLRTALLSNADSVAPEIAERSDRFDAIVLSGEAGFGKPDPRSYLLVADRLVLTPEQCVFVDDLRSNVRGAVRVGMVGIHHRRVESTLDELAALFGFDLREAEKEPLTAADQFETQDGGG